MKRYYTLKRSDLDSTLWHLRETRDQLDAAIRLLEQMRDARDAKRQADSAPFYPPDNELQR